MIQAFFALLALVAGFLRQAITPIKTGPVPPSASEMNGALPNQSGLVTLFNNLATNGAPAFGNFQQTLIPNIAAATYNAAALTGGIIRRFTPGAAATDSTDTATNIVNAIPGAVVGQTYLTMIANLGSGNITVAGGTGVTVAGTAVIASNSTRLFLSQVTGSAAVTMTNCFAFGNGLGFTGTTGL